LATWRHVHFNRIVAGVAADYHSHIGSPFGQKYRRRTMSSPIDIVTGFLSSFTRNDPDYIAGFVAEGFRNVHDSALGSGCVGREEYRRRLPHFLAAFSDRTYSIDDIVEQQRPSVTDVVVRYRFTATYEETPFEIPGVMWFSVRDDVITKRVDTWDSLTFLRQTNQTDL
jgi:ketosteroid isomerase-like protein